MLHDALCVLLPTKHLPRFTDLSTTVDGLLSHYLRSYYLLLSSLYLLLTAPTYYLSTFHSLLTTDYLLTYLATTWLLLDADELLMGC